MEVVSCYCFDLFSCLFPPRAWLKATDIILCFDPKRGCYCVFLLDISGLPNGEWSLPCPSPPWFQFWVPTLCTNLRHLPLSPAFTETIIRLHTHQGCFTKNSFGKQDSVCIKIDIRYVHKQELQIRQYLSTCWGSPLAFWDRVYFHFKVPQDAHHLMKLTILQAIRGWSRQMFDKHRHISRAVTC